MNELNTADLEQIVGGIYEDSAAEDDGEYVYNPETGTWEKSLRVSSSSSIIYTNPWKPPPSWGYPP